MAAAAAAAAAAAGLWVQAAVALLQLLQLAARLLAHPAAAALAHPHGAPQQQVHPPEQRPRHLQLHLQPHPLGPSASTQLMRCCCGRRGRAAGAGTCFRSRCGACTRCFGSDSMVHEAGHQRLIELSCWRIPPGALNAKCRIASPSFRLKPRSAPAVRPLGRPPPPAVHTCLPASKPVARFTLLRLELQPTPQCAHFAAFHRLPREPTRVFDQRPSRAYIGQFTPAGDVFIGRADVWGMGCGGGVGCGACSPDCTALRPCLDHAPLTSAAYQPERSMHAAFHAIFLTSTHPRQRSKTYTGLCPFLQPPSSTSGASACTMCTG